MSISPANSEVGSPTCMAINKCATSSTRVLFGELTSLDIEAGIRKSASINFGKCDKYCDSKTSTGRRVRTSSHCSNTSSFSVGSKNGSRKELDRADMDLDWRSSSRLRFSSGSSEEEGSHSKKGSDDKLHSMLNRADRDMNWRNHDSQSCGSSRIPNWRAKMGKNDSSSCSGNHVSRVLTKFLKKFKILE